MRQVRYPVAINHVLLPVRRQSTYSATASGHAHGNGNGDGAVPAAASATRPESCINPPVSTLPPLLEIPDSEPSQGKLKRLLAVGKAYLNFYKAGVKAVLTNYRAARQLVLRSSSSNTANTTSPPPALIFARPLELPPSTWSRSDWILYRRARHDVFRLPVFALLVLVCDELTPLVVCLFTGIVPLTCRIPGQIAEDEAKSEGRRKGSFQWLDMWRLRRLGIPTDGADAAAVSDAVARGAKTTPDYLALGQEKARIHATRALGIVGMKWDAVLGLERIPPGAWRLKGASRMAFIAGDDELLRRRGLPLIVPATWPSLEESKDPVTIMKAAVRLVSDEEIRMACKDRGIDVSGRSVEDMRDDLARWLWLTAGRSWDERRRRTTAMVLRRQQDWPTSRQFEVPKWYL